MTIKELRFIDNLLARIQPQDEQVKKAQAYVNKDLAIFAARKGQLKEMYERDYLESL